MVQCENCGSSNEDGSIFCATCGSKLIGQPSHVAEIDVLKKQAAAELVRDRLPFRQLSPQQKSQLSYYVALTAGLLVIALSISTIIPESIDYILSGTFMIIGLTITFLESRQSSRDISFFVAITLGILTIGLVLMFDNAIDYIFPAGFVLVGLTLSYYYSRQSSRHPSFFVVVALGILTMGLSLTFSDSIDYIFPVGFVLIALTLTYYFSRQSSRDPLFFVGVAVGILTLGAALTFEGAEDIFFSAGFLLIAVVVIAWALKRLFAESSHRNPGSDCC